jgi:hypothetical protein
MRGRSTLIMMVALLVAAAGCSDDSVDSKERGEAAGVTFNRVELPAGGVPTTLAPAGDTLLIGTRRDGQAQLPGMLKRGLDGTVAEIPGEAVSPYGKIARWFSIVSDGQRILGVGGENGGAHGNVRWSVWTGGPNEVSEKAQAFTTFSGYGSGELTDVVLTPSGPAIVGTWQSAKAGYDLATWTLDGEDWIRQESAGTALESKLDALGFPVSATALGQGILVAGWELTGKPGSGPTPAVWRSSSGITGWTKTELPDPGHDAAAMSVRCWETTCGIAGRVDGKLAAWRLSGDAWKRIPDAPPVPVTDKDHLAAPVPVEGQLTLLVSEGGQVKVARTDGTKWTVHPVNGPTGNVVSTAIVGSSVYLVAGPDDAHLALWQADVAALSR